MTEDTYLAQLAHADTLAAQIKSGNNSSLGDLRAILMNVVTQTLATLPRASLVQLLDARKLDFDWHQGARHPGVVPRKQRASDRTVPKPRIQESRAGRIFQREIPDTDRG